MNPFVVSVSADSQFLPFLLSTSLDGTVKQWNIDSGICNYSLDTGDESLGIQWMAGENFCIFSREVIKVWNLNHFYSTFAFTR